MGQSCCSRGAHAPPTAVQIQALQPVQGVICLERCQIRYAWCECSEGSVGQVLGYACLQPLQLGLRL